ncbi:MAG: GTPase Era [Polyangiaceae bacterium]
MHTPPPSAPANSRPTRAGRVAIVGRPNVGKSTMLNALLGEPIAITSLHPQTTRESVRGVLTVEDTQYLFVDTPGVHEPRTRLGRWMNDAAREAAREADAVVLVVEVPRLEHAISALRPNDDDLALAGDLPEGRLVLAINKVDRLKDKAKLLPLIAAFSRSRCFCATVPVSAKRAHGIDRLLSEVRALLPEQPFPFEPDTLSDQPARFFVAEFVREQILQQTREEVPHGVAVVVERFDESGKMPHIEIAVHVSREAHKKILVGAGGRMMKSIGTAARARVEQMLSKQVHLKLWVRVTPGWMDDPERLSELGFLRREHAPNRKPKTDS